MYARSISLALLALPLLASAAVLPRGIENSCNTGPIQCCDSTQSADSWSVIKQLALVGIDASQITVPVGLDCSGLDILALSGHQCSSDPVCCEDNSFKGVVAIGCSPINLNI